METRAILDNSIILGGFTATLLAALSLLWTHLQKSKIALLLSLLSLAVPFTLCMLSSVLALLNAAISIYLFLGAVISETVGVLLLMANIWIAASASVANTKDLIDSGARKELGKNLKRRSRNVLRNK